MWNPRKVASRMTQRKTAGTPGKRQSSHTKRGSARAYPTPNRRRKKTQLRRHRDTLHTYTAGHNIKAPTRAPTNPSLQPPDQSTQIPIHMRISKDNLTNLSLTKSNFIKVHTQKPGNWRAHKTGSQSYTLIHRDHQRWGPAAKTHKASYRRRERRGEETDGAKKATPKV